MTNPVVQYRPRSPHHQMTDLVAIRRLFRDRRALVVLLRAQVADLELQLRVARELTTVDRRRIAELERTVADLTSQLSTAVAARVFEQHRAATATRRVGEYGERDTQRMRAITLLGLDPTTAPGPTQIVDAIAALIRDRDEWKQRAVDLGWQ